MGLFVGVAALGMSSVLQVESVFHGNCVNSVGMGCFFGDDV